MEFYIGQIFEDYYPPEVAIFCNESQKCHIEEIDSINGHLRYKIVENKTVKISDVEKAREKIMKYNDYLNFTDWYVTRKIETGKEIPEDVLNQRNEAREEISKLLNENEELKKYFK
ncbi:hypothetical protein J6W34_04585 [bacterium]|nr:hypothetical protein [bacterium]